MNVFGSLSMLSRAVFFALIVIGGAALFWGRGFIGHADGNRRGRSRPRPADQSGPARWPTNDRRFIRKAGESLKIGPVASREFALFKTAVGTIDFNEDLLVQVFSQYPGKILKAFYNIGDEVKAGNVLFTIDSPDLLAAKSTLLASRRRA